MDELTQKRRRIVAVYVGWAFINLIILLMADGNRGYFFPFETDRIDAYDITEFLVFVVGPIIAYFIYKVFTGK